MQPLRCSAAKDNSITHAAAAQSNLDAATTMRSAATELQNTKELHATASAIAAQNGSRRQRTKKTILKHFVKWCLKGKLLAPKLGKSADKSLWQPGCSHSNTIYDLQLQKTIVLRMQPRHRATLTQPSQCVSQHPVANLHLSTHVATSKDDNEAAFQCNLQPEIQEPHRTTHTGTTTSCKTHRRNNSRTKRPQPQPPHRRGTFHRRLQPLYTEKHKVSCSGFLHKT